MTISMTIIIIILAMVEKIIDVLKRVSSVKYVFHMDSFVDDYNNSNSNNNSNNSSKKNKLEEAIQMKMKGMHFLIT